MKGVKPLRRRDGARRRRSPSARSGERPRISAPPRFELELEAEFVAGRGPGTQRARVAALRRGDFPVEERIDLHRLSTEAARRSLATRIPAAARRGVRCLLVIHGRGSHSKDGRSALREATVAALTSSPCAALVRAFVTARRRDGGPGALYVLLGTFRDIPGAPGASAPLDP
jgi:DNA-nicking Smr family endonuclease